MALQGLTSAPDPAPVADAQSPAVDDALTRLDDLSARARRQIAALTATLAELDQLRAG